MAVDNFTGRFQKKFHFKQPARKVENERQRVVDEGNQCIKWTKRMAPPLLRCRRRKEMLPPLRSFLRCRLREGRIERQKAPARVLTAGECNRHIARPERLQSLTATMVRRASLWKIVVEQCARASPCRRSQDLDVAVRPNHAPRSGNSNSEHSRGPSAALLLDVGEPSAPRPRMLKASAYWAPCHHITVMAGAEKLRNCLGLGDCRRKLSVQFKLLAGLSNRSHGRSRISAVQYSSNDSAKGADASTADFGRKESFVLETLDNRVKNLKTEFEAVQRGFMNVPEAIRALPKMDPNGVYANYNLRLDQIKVYGFDYDYTLAHYTAELQPLIYNLAIKHLVKEYRYPESCLNFKYDADFPIRGLYYDKKNGNLLKLDFFHSVEPHGCFFGRRRLSRPELEAQYGGKHISVSDIPNLVALMDLFCLSEACLISDVIQHFVDQNLEFDSTYVYDDVKRSIEFVHRSGLMHNAILSDPPKYLVKNDGVVNLLKALKQKGKRLFILTNSPFPFVNGGMRYLFQGDGRSGDSWRDLFDVVLASADKPLFYTSERPFRHYSTRTDMLGFSKVDHFGEHAVYYHGCLKSFLDITKWTGSEVLYCGDHLYTDLRGPAKAGWRTAAIIRELEREIVLQNKLDYRIPQAKYNVIQELLGQYHKLPEDSQLGEDQQAMLMALRRERQSSRIAMRAHFNTYFGSCFLTDTGKESAFAYNVQRYADIYTSRLENLMHSSHEPWLYTPFDLKSLPHHIKVPPSSFMKTQ